MDEKTIKAMRKYAQGILDYRKTHKRGPSMKDRVLEHYLELTKDFADVQTSHIRMEQEG